MTRANRGSHNGEGRTYGPMATHCHKGHDLAVVGVESSGRCRECRRQIRERAKKTKRAGKTRRIAKPQRPPDSAAVDRMLDLMVRRECAMPGREFDEMTEEIERLRRQINA